MGLQVILRGGRPVVGFGEAGHIGGSYDWWWQTIGRHAGLPYAPLPGVGIGQALATPIVATAPSPLIVALAGGAATAATGWLLERVWEHLRP